MATTHVIDNLFILCYYSSSFIRFVCINLIIFWLLLCKIDSSQFPIFLILKLSSILLVSGFVDFLDQLQLVI